MGSSHSWRPDFNAVEHKFFIISVRVYLIYKASFASFHFNQLVTRISLWSTALRSPVIAESAHPVPHLVALSRSLPKAERYRNIDFGCFSIRTPALVQPSLIFRQVEMQSQVRDLSTQYSCECLQSQQDECNKRQNERNLMSVPQALRQPCFQPLSTSRREHASGRLSCVKVLAAKQYSTIREK